MPAITVKNIPDPLYKCLKLAAQAHHRSINSEIISCLEKELTPSKIPVESKIARAKTLRKRVHATTLKPLEIKNAIEKGRL